ncbi:MAG: hypothetical protein NT157_06870 [Candidatus Micrarchaeota archaeon]|nr:hypothetical protein [Candidatus Micrarchaeota archaeon]
MIDGEMNLSLGGQKISLDRAQQRICYVSHAHSDHAGAMKSKEKLIFASKETAALARRQIVPPFFDDGLHVSLHNSGHILGSTQLKAEHDGRVFVYTGDFMLSDGLTTIGE